MRHSFVLQLDSYVVSWAHGHNTKSSSKMSYLFFGWVAKFNFHNLRTLGRIWQWRQQFVIREYKALRVLSQWWSFDSDFVHCDTWCAGQLFPSCDHGWVFVAALPWLYIWCKHRVDTFQNNPSTTFSSARRREWILVLFALLAKRLL